MVPPEAVKVALPPLQKVSAPEAVIVGDGTALTVTVCEVDPEHPSEVAVRVYPVVVVGFTTMLPAVDPPGVHTYVPPPDAVKVEDVPLHNVKDDDGVIVGVGSGFTVTVTKAAVLAQG